MKCVKEEVCQQGRVQRYSDVSRQVSACVRNHIADQIYDQIFQQMPNQIYQQIIQRQLWNYE